MKTISQNKTDKPQTMWYLNKIIKNMVIKKYCGYIGGFLLRTGYYFLLSSNRFVIDCSHHCSYQENLKNNSTDNKLK